VKRFSSSSIGLFLLAACLLLYPIIFSGPFYRDIGVTFLLAAISASAWNIVGGYAGQVSVGHSMFFGLGAYTPLLFHTLWGWPPLAGIPVGILLSVALSVVIGLPTFRLSGHYFSMATIAVAELIRIYFGTWVLVGAAIGLQGPAKGRGWWDLTFRGELPYYYIFLGVLALVLYVTFAVERRRFGFYLRAIKATERAARSLGVPVRQTKLQALALSAAFTSTAGSLYAAKTGFIDPDSGFGILVSVQMVIVAALGGAGTLFGPLLGAAILIPLQAATNTWFGGSDSGFTFTLFGFVVKFHGSGAALTYILYGGIIVLIARFEPGGLLDLWRRLAPRLWKSVHAA
jgi:branched-chain amino acid transport system permease protein